MVYTIFKEIGLKTTELFKVSYIYNLFRIQVEHLNSVLGNFKVLQLHGEMTNIVLSLFGGIHISGVMCG